MSEWTAIVPFQEGIGETRELALRAAAEKLDELIPGSTELVVVPTKHLERWTIGFVASDGSGLTA